MSGRHLVNQYTQPLRTWLSSSILQAVKLNSWVTTYHWIAVQFSWLSGWWYSLKGIICFSQNVVLYVVQWCAKWQMQFSQLWGDLFKTLFKALQPFLLWESLRQNQLTQKNYSFFTLVLIVLLHPLQSLTNLESSTNTHLTFLNLNLWGDKCFVI